MLRRSSNSNVQRGAFTIELALVLVFVTGFFVMQVNFLVATAKKGQMDRLAYSLVSVMSERRELFRDEGDICRYAGECELLAAELYAVGISAMNRMSNQFDSNKFGIRIEELVVYPDRQVYAMREVGWVTGCSFTPLREVDKIIPTTSRNRKLPVYKVSLCYRTPFNLLGASKGELLNVVTSAFSFARI
ncbi:pilus assembly protein TadF [Vibrio sp. vnigr-6D03]|uniref:tight adherence pilus pseudopilin TadF n=1 Tax=Vibrio TaxID=662 RepID=UPI000C31DA4A|nr:MULTISPECIES: tight adherence pilus pseudopilin TadF [Vibrio]MDP2574362.1 tight adherence pilus pseudopilin TadF [Vibrio penaeicida]PKF78149.1 pilus assembly protein TadF [Vibrio sp. vnigr-6D03]